MVSERLGYSLIQAFHWTIAGIAGAMFSQGVLDWGFTYQFGYMIGALIVLFILAYVVRLFIEEPVDGKSRGNS